MKVFLCFFTILVFNSWANSWTVGEDKSNYYIFNKSDQKLKIAVPSVNKPKIIEIKSYDRVELIVYYQGEIGSNEQYKSYRVAIFDKIKKKFHPKTYVYKNEPITKQESPYKQWDEKTDWKVEGKTIRVLDANGRLYKVIDLEE